MRRFSSISIVFIHLQLRERERKNLRVAFFDRTADEEDALQRAVSC
jgi:vacuolar-type H+-ATPase subunit C/Vma6